MERTLTAERIQALAKAVRDVAQNRPNRRRVRGIGKTHGGQQVETAAGNGDHRSVALQERVLLDRAVKSVLRIHWIVALVKGRGMIAQHAVGHRHFCSQGLNGFQALIGINDSALELLILLLQGFLIVAKRVIVADLPQHSRIGAYGYSHADRSDDRQYGNTVQ